MNDPEFESRVLAFEQAWQRSGAPEIGDYLGDPFHSASPLRDQLLVELICIDLEFRWRRAFVHRPTTLAEYAERYLAAFALEDLPVELIGEEYRARRLWGDRPSHAEFLVPFRERREQLRAELLRVDAEIEEDAADTRDCGRDRAPRLAAEHRIMPDAAVGLHSDREFLLLRLIGAGRMGKVYQARWQDGGPDVAVKFLRKSFLRDPDAVQRFLDEARTIAGLSHPNIVGTRGLGRTAAGSYFIVMDLVAGPNLAKFTGQRRASENEILGWSIELCDALAHAHSQSIVHCDLKPANILLDQSGRVKVTDFGLARWLGGDVASAAEVEGTVPFMAPEQVSRSWGPIDQRTDIYGIGAVLFTLLTGRAPHLGQRLPDVLAEVVACTPVVSLARLRPDLSPLLIRLCQKCLSKRMVDRYQTVGELRSSLAEVLAGLPGEDAV